MSSTIRDRVIDILRAQGNIPTDGLTDASDLYAAGLSSFSSVQVMLALEQAFDCEFPEHMLNRRTFSSIGEIVGAVETLTVNKAA